MAEKELAEKAREETPKAKEKNQQREEGGGEETQHKRDDEDNLWKKPDEHRNNWNSSEEMKPEKYTGDFHEGQHRGYSEQQTYRSWPYDQTLGSGNIGRPDQ